MNILNPTTPESITRRIAGLSNSIRSTLNTSSTNTNSSIQRLNNHLTTLDNLTNNLITSSSVTTDQLDRARNTLRDMSLYLINPDAFFGNDETNTFNHTTFTIPVRHDIIRRLSDNVETITNSVQQSIEDTESDTDSVFGEGLKMDNRHVIGTGIYDRFMNYMLPYSRNKLRHGEVHPPVWTGKRFEIPSYLGPGTNLADKIRADVEPISMVDKVAQAHDLRYAFASSVEDVRNADVKMVNKLNEIQDNNQDYKINIYTGKLPIMAKMKMEDLGLFSPDKFTSFKQPAPENRDKMRSKLSELEAQGFGRKKKSKWIEHVKKYQKENNCTYKQALIGASLTYKK